MSKWIIHKEAETAKDYKVEESIGPCPHSPHIMHLVRSFFWLNMYVDILTQNAIGLLGLV